MNNTDILVKLLTHIMGTDKLVLNRNYANNDFELCLGYSFPLLHVYNVEEAIKACEGVLSNTVPYKKLQARILELEAELKEYKSIEISKGTLSDL